MDSTTSKPVQLTAMQEANMKAVRERQLQDRKSLNDQRLEKLMVLADAIEAITITEDGSLHLKTKNHLVIESEGHQVFHSKDGQVVLKHQKIHLNPTTTIVKDTGEFVKQVEADAEEQSTKINEDCDCGPEQ